LATPPAQ